MDLGAGYGGLAIAFVLLAGVLVWIMIHAPGRFLLKALLIPPILWYGVALFFTAQNLMGWPAAARIPDSARVLAVRVDEPNPATKSSGAIYLWVSQQPDPFGTVGAGKRTPLDPRTAFAYPGSNEPRAYKLPYTRDLHRSIARAQAGLDAAPGAQMNIRHNHHNQGSATNRKEEAGLSLELVRPESLLPEKEGGTARESHSPPAPP